MEGEAITRSDDGTMADDNPTKIHVDLLGKALGKIGRPVADLSKLAGSLRAAGFVDVKVELLKQPLGMWPRDPKMKKIGAMVTLNAETAFHAYGMAMFTRVLGMETEEAESICIAASQAIKNKAYHMYNLL